VVSKSEDEMVKAPDAAAIERLLAPAIAEAGFEIVRIAFISTPAFTLQVMVEDPATGQMLVDQCARLSRRLSLILDEADPIDCEYSLEVSSPGIDRPLTRAKDYARWAGHVAKIELHEAVPAGGPGRKRFQGVLTGLAGDEVRLAVEGLGEIGLPLAAIRTAKLVLTDRLIAETAPSLSAEGAEDFEEEAADDASDERVN
jgi:ribosome maturation factor RimP